MPHPNTLNFRLENVAPILWVKDMAQSLAFYAGRLGFQKAEWGDDVFTSVNRDNTGLYLGQGGQGTPGTWAWLGFVGNLLPGPNTQEPIHYAWGRHPQPSAKRHLKCVVQYRGSEFIDRNLLIMNPIKINGRTASADLADLYHP
jgi:catechol 2,3-dioxygenase-like lactoylglutathione lyase family enzyme